MRRRFNHWWKYQKAERAWRKAQKRKRPGFLERFLFFLLSPIADLRDERNRKKEIKKTFQKGSQPFLLTRLWLVYKENRQFSQEKKNFQIKVKKSLSYDPGEDKTIFSFSDKINHLKDTWKSLPWNSTRESENVFITFLVFILSFFANFLAIQFAKFIAALYYHIPSSWSQGKLVFNIPDTSALWTYSSVISIYIAGPILLLVIGVIFLFLHRKTKDKSSVAALLYLWIYINALILFFGNFLAGIFTDRGFGYIFGWLYIPKYIEIPFGIFSVFMIWIIGHSAGKKIIPFLPKKVFYDSPLPQFFSKCIYLYSPIVLAIICLYTFGLNGRDFTIQIVYLSILGMLTPTLRFIPEKMT